MPGSVLVTVDATVSTADGIPGILDFAFLGPEASYLAALSITQPLVSESLLSAGAMLGSGDSVGTKQTCFLSSWHLHLSNTIKQIIT